MLDRTERDSKAGGNRNTAHPPGGSRSQSIADLRLIELSADFIRYHARWVAQFSEDALDQPRLCAELEDLRSAWKSALRQIQLAAPASLPAARAKLEAAQVYAAWAAPGEAGTSEFLNLAVAQLSPFLSDHGVNGKPITPDRLSADSRTFQWFERFARHTRIKQ